MQKKAEKEFNTRFKVIFISVVASHMTLQARTMQVIDMTRAEATTTAIPKVNLTPMSKLSRKTSTGSRGKS